MNLEVEPVIRKTFLSGDTILDAMIQNQGKADLATSRTRTECSADRYARLAMHRPQNVDVPQTLTDIMNARPEHELGRVVFPSHTGARKRLEEAGPLRSLVKSRRPELADPIGQRGLIKLNARKL
mgnify:CR=1 FL=1